MDIKGYNEEFLEYLRDESRWVGDADFICFPQNEQDVISAVEFCRNNEISLTIQGSRTGITAGAVPQSGLILNLERMNKVAGLQKGDGCYYLSVQPGLKLRELRKMLFDKSFDTDGWSDGSLKTWQDFKKDRRHFFPPDPTETSASIGGMAACNASGARSFKYGASRKWIAGIKLIPSPKDLHQFDDISLTKINPEMKNASGFFLQSPRRDIDLIIGSEGTLGIISDIKLKIIPEPFHYCAVMQFFSVEESALKFCKQLRNQDDKPIAIEYFSKNALELLRNNRQLWKDLPDLKKNWQYAVYLEFSDDDKEILEDLAFSAAELAEEYGSGEQDSWFVDNQIGIENLKNFRHAVPESINLKLDKIKKEFPSIAKISTDLVVPEGFLPQMVKMYNEIQKGGFEVVVFGHIGNNHLHTNIIPKNPDEYKKGQEIAKYWAKKAVEFGGSVSGEHGIGKSKKELFKIMYSPQEIDVMKKIKEQIDPKRIFNPENLF